MLKIAVIYDELFELKCSSKKVTLIIKKIFRWWEDKVNKIVRDEALKALCEHKVRMGNNRKMKKIYESENLFHGAEDGRPHERGVGNICKCIQVRG